MFGDNLQAILVILGFVVLGGAILFAKLRNKQTPAEFRQTEEATRRNYHEQSAEDRARTP
ncbi:LPXTG cell wall anchor domain-containing protein [Sphingomonas sp. HHU CXW]|uniref:LPXTG cell wall anchor domain-containing protein n=1 Tax=Sphingomonas hominis TaxID=2741495 RepID=A0ABX2JQC2_9SPHN|nr:LPXTG cell wall anchor domain-containing protein [Sphingomonas hominis]NTS66043.1 LPXTG cell wall anchor domain-containing protein [Sphingomonas hominis]